VNSLGFSCAARRLFATSVVAQLPGAAVAGVVVDTDGATTAFALAGLAAASATLTTIVRRRRLPRGAVDFRLEDDAPGGAPCPSVS
jgi:hypothetical protein